jgi:hypothetical protein
MLRLERCCCRLLLRLLPPPLLPVCRLRHIYIYILLLNSRCRFSLSFADDDGADRDCSLLPVVIAV